MTDRVGPGPRILLVEDEPANRALVRAIIARTDRDRLQGAVLHEAASIADARSVLASHTIDIVLVDVRLPDGNGLDLAAELRATQGLEHTRVVVVSASVLSSERALALASGADAFLGKPFLAADLLDIIQGFEAAAN